MTSPQELCTLLDGQKGGQREGDASAAAGAAEGVDVNAEVDELLKFGEEDEALGVLVDEDKLASALNHRDEKAEAQRAAKSSLQPQDPNRFYTVIQFLFSRFQFSILVGVCKFTISVSHVPNFPSPIHLCIWIS